MGNGSNESDLTPISTRTLSIQLLTKYDHSCLVLETLPDFLIQHLTEIEPLILNCDVIDDKREICVNIIQSFCEAGTELRPDAIVESVSQDGLGSSEGGSPTPRDAINLPGDSAGKESLSTKLKRHMLIGVNKDIGRLGTSLKSRVQVHSMN